MSVINREDAIKALEEVVGAMHPYRIPGVIETYSQYNEAWQDAINKAEQAIEALPDADDGWILVEDRLPEEYEEVLVWYEYFRYGDFNCMCQTYGIGWYARDMWHGDVSGTKARCIAWEPLPKPYEPKEDT